MYKIIQKRKIWISISVVLFVTAIVFISTWGLKLGIDFTGGSLLEVKFGANKPNVIEVSDSVKDLKLNSLSVQPSENSFILRFQDSSEDVHQKVLVSLKKLNDGKNPVKAENKGTSTTVVATTGFEELNFTGIGPSIGQELQKKAISAIILVLIAISLYISYAFRKVSKPIASWKYGVATLIALFHDTVIVIGFFALLGKVWGVEVNTSFVAAVLTVLGFSVHDTIVVFDRIRENLPKSADNFEDTINRSVNQTLTRSINTSMTVMFVLMSIVLFGGSSIKYFALALFVGIFFGTYSSIFLASPLLVVWNNLKKKI
ncbi:protein translocase subunit SecF [Candidatus Falkowbacteria bacterium CG10_big_fil_rev_8_21_14_0_10_39_9]|uniref:Protein-export membrane protein SecF n=1 Tax=Candidatus Falkowbacteria bacterium CG10_big_fil_rev_8_21_14_0_10_39_9 TaxID=1974566 RepID=A0A2M6WNK0_9BACT|nr:MAG: protein translocase subunit SecF [Candidatus Falkowbacteria bacterium CG10_big_fil_rev_8_21_14_0_10_39_9]